MKSNKEQHNSKFMGDAQKAYKAPSTHGDDEKVHIPNTLKDSDSESESFGEKLKMLQGMGDVGRSSSKQGHETTSKQV
jgi:hypothetical protein